VERAGIRTRELIYCNRFGQTVWQELRGTSAGCEVPQFSIHRGKLLGVLHQAAVERLGPARLHTACRLVGFAPRGDRVVASFEHANGERFEVAADALIGADGIHSTIRALLFGGDQPRFAGQICWRFVVDSDKLAALPEPLTWHGPNGHVVMYLVSAGRRVNVVAYVESEHWFEESWHLSAEREEVHRAYPGWDPLIHELIDKAERVNKWAMFAREPLPRWTDGRVTLAGDAAHPMLPFLAQGAVMAIEDAYALGTLLAKLPAPAALATYEALRLPRATAVQRAARSRQAMMAPAGASDGGAAAITHVEQIYAYDIVAAVAAALDRAR
jgi:salicylate hydroxylase